MKHVGITATRDALTPEQVKVAGVFFANATAKEQICLHHGDCVGGDAAIHGIAFDLGCKITIHPPSNDSLRAWCDGDEILPEKEYLVRNKDIVRACVALLAFPNGPETRRSGTWSTVRFAVAQKKPVLIVYPNGSTERR